jgi:hypothetical protein
VRAAGGNQTITVTDTVGNQYRKATQLVVTADNTSLAIFYAENGIGGANTVSVALGQSATLRVGILEYTGVATTASLAATASAQGASTTLNSGPVTTTTGGALLIAAFLTANPATFSPGNSFTLRASVPNGSAKLGVADRVLAVPGAVSATASISSSDVWGAVVVAFTPQ